jgi:hypothetical protein
MIPATPNKIVSDATTPNVTGIANVVSNAITPTVAVPTTTELINPSSPKYHVIVNIINRMIVAKIMNTILRSTTS